MPAWIIHTSMIEDASGTTKTNPLAGPWTASSGLWGHATPVAVAGPSNADQEDLDWLLDDNGFPFRLLDDDHEIYYLGRCLEEAFDPLDDYGKPNAGCTIIEYQAWKAL